VARETEEGRKRGITLRKGRGAWAQIARGAVTLGDKSLVAGRRRQLGIHRVHSPHGDLTIARCCCLIWCRVEKKVGTFVAEIPVCHSRF